MKQLVIIGGGHAGVSAVLASARARQQLKKTSELQIYLINPESISGVRPRYYEYELEQTQVDLVPMLARLQVNFISGHVDNINLAQQSLQLSSQQTIHFDRLILAAGSQLVQPPIPQITQHSFNIDTYQAAMQLRQQLTMLVKSAKHELSICILGAGITGTELACELPITIGKICHQLGATLPKLHIHLIDRHDIATNNSIALKPYLQQAFQQAGVHLHNHAQIEAIDHRKVIFSSGEIEADVIISTLGLKANLLTEKLELAKDQFGRIKLNSHLQIPTDQHSYAAGDIGVCYVDEQHTSIMSCQQARPQGKVAGTNAVFSLFDQPLLNYQQPNYVTCIDLGAYGAVYCEGWDRQVIKFGEDAKKIKRHINTERIYPPINGGPEELFAAGKPEFIAPLATIGDHNNG